MKFLRHKFCLLCHNFFTSMARNSCEKSSYQTAFNLMKIQHEYTRARFLETTRIKGYPILANLTDNTFQVRIVKHYEKFASKYLILCSEDTRTHTHVSTRFFPGYTLTYIKRQGSKGGRQTGKGL